MTTTALPGKSPTSVTLIAHDTLQAHPKHRASARVKCRIATDMRLELHTMNPVAIFRFSPDDGPGYFASFLDRHSIPWQLFKIDDGDDIPHNLSSFSGLVFMGGPMSVNDDLPWIPPILGAIRTAISRGQPCIGHCLGGQLMSKALGGLVSVNAVKEIGWNPVIAENNDIALEWLSEDFVKQSILTTFQWHGETFTLPAGATRILTGEACANQAFVVEHRKIVQAVGVASKFHKAVSECVVVFFVGIAVQIIIVLGFGGHRHRAHCGSIHCGSIHWCNGGHWYF